MDYMDYRNLFLIFSFVIEMMGIYLLSQQIDTGLLIILVGIIIMSVDLLVGHFIKIMNSKHRRRYRR